MIRKSGTSLVQRIKDEAPLKEKIKESLSGLNEIIMYSCAIRSQLFGIVECNQYYYAKIKIATRGILRELTIGMPDGFPGGGFPDKDFLELDLISV